jgi:hypothetical protein
MIIFVIVNMNGCILMHLLELFSGTGSVGKVAKTMGYEVVSVDMSNKYKPTYACDIMKWNYKRYDPGYFSFIWASPPCTEFSKAKTVGIRDIDGALRLVKRAITIIKYFQPRWYAIENPVGLLRHMKLMKDLNRLTVSYCKYGYKYQKDTDIWTNIPFNPKICRNNCRCEWSRETGTHAYTSQKGPYSSRPAIKPTTSIGERYSIPGRLIRDIIGTAARV